MKRYSLLLAVVMSLSTLISNGQGINPSKQQKILFLLNASASMNEPWAGGDSKFHTAERFILNLMDSLNVINKDVEFGLRVYGDQYPALENNCYDSHLEVKFSKDNRVQMGLRLEHIKAQGISSVAYAINESLKDLVNPKETDYQVILITDSPESCSKDLCPQAKKLIDQTKVEPYVINVESNKSLQDMYGCFGHYLSAEDKHGSSDAISTILRQYKSRFISATGEGYLKIRNRDKVTIINLLYLADGSFSPILGSAELVTGLAKGIIKIKAGEYRIVYKTASSDSRNRSVLVKDGMVTEVVLE